MVEVESVNKNEENEKSGQPPFKEKQRRIFRRKRYDNRLGSFTEEVVATSRISKTTGGGKRLRFNAVVVVGDKKGKVGFAIAKAKEIPDAIKKAIRHAMNNTIQIKLVNNDTITHEVIGKAAATKVQLRPTRSGKGIVAGGPVRTIMQLGGVKNISAKIHGPRNKLNAIQATFNALKQLESKEDVMERRKDDIDWMKPTEKPPLTVIRIPQHRSDKSYKYAKKEGEQRDNRTAESTNKEQE